MGILNLCVVLAQQFPALISISFSMFFPYRDLFVGLGGGGGGGVVGTIVLSSDPTCIQSLFFELMVTGYQMVAWLS